MNKFKFLAMLVAIALLLVVTGCKKESSINIQELEQSLVGLWWDEFEYEDVTEDGVPFSRVLLAVRVDAGHTGCIYLGVFDDNSDKPLVVYGGPVDAGFTWKLLSDGSLVLSDPTSGESLLMTRADGENYGDTITDVSGTSMIYTADGLTMNNVSYSGTLTKADVDEQTDIMGKVAGEVRPLSTATASDYGKVVCDKGHLHPAKTAVPDGCTAVGILGKVTETGCGLILALKDATSQTWNTINGWTSVTTYADTELKVLPDDAARGANLTSYAALGTTAVSDWAVAQKSDYEAIFTNLGSTTGDKDGKTYDGNVNAYITTGVGGTALDGNYWSATKNNIVDLAYCFGSRRWSSARREDCRSRRRHRRGHPRQGDGDGPRPGSRLAGCTGADLVHHQRLDFHDRFRRHHAESAARRRRPRQPDELHHAGHYRRVRLGRGAEERLRGDIHQPRLDE